MTSETRGEPSTPIDGVSAAIRSTARDVSTTTAPPDANSLHGFLVRLRDARRKPEDPSGQPARGLSQLFESIAVYRRENTRLAAPARAAIDVDAYRCFLGNLQDTVATSRHDGRLLNVWTIAGLKRNEVRTSAVLGWVLDCHGSHGFGASVLEELLKILSSRGNAKKIADLRLGRNYRLLVEHCAFGERDKRVDLAIEGENCILFIEVKIDAPEGNDQLPSYAKIARDKAQVLQKPKCMILYLSESKSSAQYDDIVCLRWRDVAQAINNVVSSTTTKTVSGMLLQQFASHIRTLH